MNYSRRTTEYRNIKTKDLIMEKDNFSGKNNAFSKNETSFSMEETELRFEKNESGIGRNEVRKEESGEE